FIIGRAVNGIGSAGLLSGALLIIFAACNPKTRPLVTSLAMSLISLGAITGPLIAGALTDKVTWRWCKHPCSWASTLRTALCLISRRHLGFWIFLPLGGAVLAATLSIPIPEQSAKALPREAFADLHKKLDPMGFVMFSGAAAMLLLAVTW